MAWFKRKIQQLKYFFVGKQIKRVLSARQLDGLIFLKSWLLRWFFIGKQKRITNKGFVVLGDIKVSSTRPILRNCSEDWRLLFYILIRFCKSSVIFELKPKIYVAVFFFFFFWICNFEREHGYSCIILKSFH